MSSTKTKTPISLLQEFCQKQQLQPPKYTSKATEGGSHQPIFIFECEVEYSNVNFREAGRGNSKKQAKHESARSILEQLHHYMTKNSETCTNIPGFDQTLEQAAFGQTPSNPVTVLESKLKEKKLAMPQFKTYEAQDCRHIAECRVEHLFEKAIGPSKKTAKRAVAQIMLDKLEEYGDEELQKELNKLSSVASVMNGPIKDRAVRRKQHILDGLNIAERPESCKLMGRLNENFEDVSIQSENSTNTFGISIMKFFCHNKPDKKGDWNGEQFEKIVKICGDNAIPVRESVKKCKNTPRNLEDEENATTEIKLEGKNSVYLILVHFRAPLTFFGKGENLESKKIDAKNRVIQYLKTSYDHIQTEVERVKEKERAQEARKNKSKVRF